MSLMQPIPNRLNACAQACGCACEYFNRIRLIFGVTGNVEDAGDPPVPDPTIHSIVSHAYDEVLLIEYNEDEGYGPLHFLHVPPDPNACTYGFRDPSGSGGNEIDTGTLSITVALDPVIDISYELFLEVSIAVDHYGDGTATFVWTFTDTDADGDWDDGDLLVPFISDTYARTIDLVNWSGTEVFDNAAFIAAGAGRYTGTVEITCGIAFSVVP